jgi:hypothetical protein
MFYDPWSKRLYLPEDGHKKWPKHVGGRRAVKRHQNNIVCLLVLILYSGGLLLESRYFTFVAFKGVEH